MPRRSGICWQRLRDRDHLAIRWRVPGRRRFYFGGLSGGTEMDIATWLVAVPWRNSFIGAFSGEFQNLRSDASSGKRTSAVRAPTGQLPSMTSLAHHIKHFAAVFGDRCARVRHLRHEHFRVTDDDLSDQIRCHSFLCLLTGRVGVVWTVAERCRHCMCQVRIERLYVFPEHLKTGRRHSTRTARKERWRGVSEAPDLENRPRSLPDLSAEC